MSKFIIICDNFQMGGIQRLALDQAYALSEHKIETLIIVLSSKPDEKSGSFYNAEAERIAKSRVKFLFMPYSRFQQTIKIQKVLKNFEVKLIISHSLKGTVIFSLIKKTISYKILLVSIIHQLPALSAPVQRIKRYFYSQFTDFLFAYSVAVMNDWNYRRAHNPFVWLISSRKQIKLCRNGVFLPRLKVDENLFLEKENELKRLLFVNRLTAWKGLSIFLQVAGFKEFDKTEILLITPTDPNPYLANLKTEVRIRVKSIVGESVSRIPFEQGDVHIYPASYGIKSRFVEAIGLNVLEMASMGIVSVVSKEGTDTWPELVSIGIIREVDWSDKAGILSAVADKFISIDLDTLRNVRQIVDINNNIKEILEETKLEYLIL